MSVRGRMGMGEIPCCQNGGNRRWQARYGKSRLRRHNSRRGGAAEMQTALVLLLPVVRMIRGTGGMAGRTDIGISEKRYRSIIRQRNARYSGSSPKGERQHQQPCCRPTHHPFGRTSHHLHLTPFPTGVTVSYGRWNRRGRNVRQPLPQGLHESTRSPCGNRTAATTTPKQIGNSQPPMPGPSSKDSTLGSNDSGC